MKLSIIIPTYNEATFIHELIRRIKRVELPYGITKEIIIIDDGSTDETCKMLNRYTVDNVVRVYRKYENSGKAAAVRLGIKKSEGDIILIQDADLEYCPEDYSRLIEPIITYESPIVYGSRFKGKIKKMQLINRMANTISNATLNLLFNTKITDVNTCYKMFKKDVLDDIEITSNNFSFETELTCKLLHKGYTIYEVPIEYTARSKKEGKKITWLKALQMYWGIVKYRIRK